MKLLLPAFFGNYSSMGIWSVIITINDNCGSNNLLSKKMGIHTYTHFTKEASYYYFIKTSFLVSVKEEDLI